MTPAQDRRQQLRELYGFAFPEDLFAFWNFARRLKPLEPLRALEAFGMHLVGPFEVLAGRFDRRTTRYSQLLHWRYANDPPEFFTVLAGDGEGLHWGYYLDEPGESPPCVAGYFAQDVYEISEEGDSLFELVRRQIEICQAEMEELSASGSNADEGPEQEREIDRSREVLMKFATGDRSEIGLHYEEKHPPHSSRSSRVIAATLDGMGVVAPGDTYRPLSLKDRQLWKELKRNKNPLEFVQEARQAAYDGYPATALKLGKDLWAIGGETRTEHAYELMAEAYSVLRRPVLQQVLAVHRADRALPSVDILECESL